MRRSLLSALVATAAVVVPAATPAARADATVVGVPSGDTVEVRRADGTHLHIGLMGVNSPRGADCYAREATQRLALLALGRPVTLEELRGGRAYVRLADGRDLGRLLLAAGFAQIDRSAFARFATYVPVQQTADAQNRGLWSACAADLALGITGPAQAAVGERLEYAAVVRNRGPLSAPRVKLELRPARSTTLVSAAAPGGTCKTASWLAVCSFPRLAPGATARATLVVRADRPGSAFVRAAARFDWCLRARCGAAPVHERSPADDEKIALTLVGARSTASVRTPHSATPGPDIRTLDRLRFVSVCGFSHRAPDDPIVFPGAPGKSHDHTFFGNVSTNAASTAQSLRGAPTTCQRSADTAAYWAPTLVDDGKVIVPLDAVVYYNRRTIRPVRAFPSGLQIIGGDQHAASAQARTVTSWDCGEGTRATTAVPACTGSRRLRLGVRLPDCWNGRELTTGLRRTHMTYSSRGTCPRSHPVAVPSISITVTYPVAGGPGLGLASGGHLTGHADFVNGWQQAELERLVAQCLNAVRICGRTL